jgi:hypothetical protein
MNMDLPEIYIADIFREHFPVGIRLKSIHNTEVWIMKRVYVFILAFILLAGSVACAQTRESVIILEGMEEKITETLYESPDGFRLWYPEDMFRIEDFYGNDRVLPADETVEGVELIVVPVDIPTEEAGAMIAEATGGYMEGEAEIGEIEEYSLASGLEVKSVQVLCEGMISRFYLITGNESVFCLTAMYPLEAAEGFGVRINAIVDTFETVSKE